VKRGVRAYDRQGGPGKKERNGMPLQAGKKEEILSTSRGKLAPSSTGRERGVSPWEGDPFAK